MDLTATFERLSREPDAPLDLATIALYLAKEEFPDLDVDSYLRQLDQWAEALGPGLEDCTLEEQYDRLCTLLFEKAGFHGNQEDYYNPNNSYLNQVIDRRTGLPIALAAVAMAVGKRAGLQVIGIGLPGHFLAQIHDGFGSILFDPYHGGKRLRVADCTELVERATGAPAFLTPMHFEPVSLQAMLVRMLGNLRGVYMEQEDHHRAIRILQRLRQLQPDQAVFHRDLGISHLKTGQPGLAVSHLSVYLKTEPADAEAVHPLLAQAHRALAPWN